MLLHALAFSVSVVMAQMKLEVVLPQRVQVGQTVPITLRVTNHSQTAAYLYSQGRPTAFDLVISSRADGKPVWRRLEKATITAVLQIRQLQPGEVLEFTDSWDQRDDKGRRVPAGDYCVVGILPTDPPAQLRSRPEILRIGP
jgi:uncharacterized protein (DUF58 family)